MATAETTAQIDAKQVELLLDLAQRAADAQWDKWKFVDSRGQFLLGWLLTAIAVGAALGVGRASSTPLVGASLLCAALCRRPASAHRSLPAPNLSPAA